MADMQNPSTPPPTPLSAPLSASRDVITATSSMLTQLIHPLIDHPEHCSVGLVEHGDSATFVIQVAAADMDKFIGRNLRTGRSLQVIAGAVGMRAQRKFSLLFRENAGNAQSRSDPLAQSAGT